MARGAAGEVFCRRCGRVLTALVLCCCRQGLHFQGMASLSQANERKPNALILEYQKSVIWHTLIRLATVVARYRY
jgi:NO-binding membrane sensor protein with MHYT domain